MIRKRLYSASVVILITLLACLSFAGACSPNKTTTTSSTTSSTSTSQTTTTDNLTASVLAASGATVFTNYCAKCHGANGHGLTGPPIIGSSANLVKYGTAQGLLNFIDIAMPFDAPGSLSSQQYLQVLVFLLLQNNDVIGSAAIDPVHLDSIPLK